MKIEVGKTYEICAYFKKSMFEIEQFKNEETGQMLNTEIMWRNGTFFVKVTNEEEAEELQSTLYICLLYTSPSPRDLSTSRMPSSA